MVYQDVGDDLTRLVDPIFPCTLISQTMWQNFSLFFVFRLLQSASGASSSSSTSMLKSLISHFISNFISISLSFSFKASPKPQLQWFYDLVLLKQIIDIEQTRSSSDFYHKYRCYVLIFTLQLFFVFDSLIAFMIWFSFLKLIVFRLVVLLKQIIDKEQTGSSFDFY